MRLESLVDLLNTRTFSRFSRLTLLGVASLTSVIGTDYALGLHVINPETASADWSDKSGTDKSPEEPVVVTNSQRPFVGKLEVGVAANTDTDPLRESPYLDQK